MKLLPTALPGVVIVEPAVFRDERGWFLVTNTIPVTIQLVPFLLSHGGWIEVVGPESVRQEMKRRLKTAAAHYGK